MRLSLATLEFFSGCAQQNTCSAQDDLCWVGTTREPNTHQYRLNHLLGEHSDLQRLKQTIVLQHLRQLHNDHKNCQQTTSGQAATSDKSQTLGNPLTMYDVVMRCRCLLATFCRPTRLHMLAKSCDNRHRP